jgi:hypothetical protein
VENKMILSSRRHAEILMPSLELEKEETLPLNDGQPPVYDHLLPTVDVE